MPAQMAQPSLKAFADPALERSLSKHEQGELGRVARGVQAHKLLTVGVHDLLGVDADHRAEPLWALTARGDARLAGC